MTIIGTPCEVVGLPGFRPTRSPTCQSRGEVGHPGARTLYTAAVILLLAGCADKPPIISADTSCERFRHISATDAQIKVFADNWEVMESYADQIVAFNIEYDRHCIGEVK